jgi:hypothetical protein
MNNTLKSFRPEKVKGALGSITVVIKTIANISVPKKIQMDVIGISLLSELAQIFS